MATPRMTPALAAPTAVWAMKLMVIVCLAALTALLGSRSVSAAPGDPLEVTVDGRIVTYDPATAQGQLNGAPATLEEVLNALAPGPVQASFVEREMDDGTAVVLPGVEAVVQDHFIRLTNLSQLLAGEGNLSIWISGGDAVSSWKICIIITWGSYNNPIVTVDQKPVDASDVVVELDGKPSNLTLFSTALGTAPMTATNVIVVSNGVTLTTPAARAVVTGNHIDITHLTQELAIHGRLSIWIEGANWRICIIIVWGSDSALAATVDDRPVTNGGQMAQINGTQVEMERVLAIIGGETITETDPEIFVSPGVTISVPAASAVMKGNKIAFHNLTHELAQYGRLEIYLGRTWRICIIIIWGSDSALAATVDGRPVTVEDPVALVDGATSDVERVLAINGSEVVTDNNLEIMTLGGVTITAPTARAVVSGNDIAISNLSHELAQYGRLAVWISGKNWRICIIIVWGNADTPTAVVDGRDVVIAGSLAQLQGATIDLARAFDMLGSAPVTSTDVQVVTTDGVTLTAPGVSAVLRGSQIELHKLSEQLATHLVINIWIRFTKDLRICITIEIDENGVPTVVLNGRPVTSEGAVTEMLGEQVETARLFTYLETLPPTTTTDIELVKNGVTSPVPNAQAIVAGDRITITGPADVLQGVRISIWINFRDFRVCIIISFERLTSPDGNVVVDVPPHNVHGGLDLSYLGLSAPSKPLPAGAIGVRHFNLHAHSTAGPVHQLDVEYSIAMLYTDAQLAGLGIDENSLRLLVLDATTNTWQPVASTVDAANNKVVGMLDHFSEFAVVGNLAPERKTFLPIIDR